MRFISWNVNGLRAVVKKGFEDIFWSLDADFVCLQETKLQEGQISLDRVRELLVLCREKGLLRHGDIHPPYAPVREL